MGWIAVATALVGLLELGEVNLGTASGVAPLVGVPTTLAFLTVLAQPGAAVAIALCLAALYSWLARGVWQNSTVALGLSLVLLLGDLGGGALAALEVSGEMPPALVVLLAALFLAPRLGLMYLLGQCLRQQKGDPIAVKIGALTQGLVRFLVDPIGWIIHRRN
ncbi:hypothetical protein [Leptolyngbya sp. KIOST-1]|uniref:hypothetical protein n=1 Tax=Leptolyngbya sp. KIOST-1 TaxID=1229172 RepID=UPI000569A3CF|nr:hypothetical protein [Leptolyngbya sp. KIOST-1]